VVLVLVLHASRPILPYALPFVDVPADPEPADDTPTGTQTIKCYVVPEVTV